MKNLKAWLRNATPEERTMLSANSGASMSYLYQLAADDGDASERRASAAMAIAIEVAAHPITTAAGGRLPKILRTDVCEACQKCEFAQQVLGDAAITSQFRYVDVTNLGN